MSTRNYIVWYIYLWSPKQKVAVILDITAAFKVRRKKPAGEGGGTKTYRLIRLISKEWAMWLPQLLGKLGAAVSLVTILRNKKACGNSFEKHGTYGGRLHRSPVEDEDSRKASAQGTFRPCCVPPKCSRKYCATRNARAGPVGPCEDFIEHSHFLSLSFTAIALELSSS